MIVGNETLNSNSSQKQPPLPTILVVDDLLENLFIFQKLIEKNLKTHRVLMTNNPLEGLKLASNHHPDAILLDFQMPNIDGVELCRRLKADKSLKSIPVILITGNLVTSKLKAEGLKAGALDFLVKPIDMTVLISKLHDVLNSNSSQGKSKKQVKNLKWRLPYVKKIKDRLKR